HYNGTFVEPWGRRSQRGYGVEVIQRFFEEAAFVEFGGPPALRAERLEQMRSLPYNDLAADRHIVAVVQAMEAILREHTAGRPGSMVEVNTREGGLVLRRPGSPEPVVLYPGKV
ncbi:MAG TPA: gfo/Idh/MocA family oxidoreductase, partial [Gemmataceae bacterium]|nr:gfo/Idh/MocA family oxidoreductase [Gemmataceae bacterium]